MRTAISTGRATLPDVDHRTYFMRRLRELVEDITADLGPSKQLSETATILVRRAAMLTVQIELMEKHWVKMYEGEAPPKSLTNYGRATNTLRRTFEALGLVPERYTSFKDITPKSDMTADEAREALRSRGITIDGDSLFRSKALDLEEPPRRYSHVRS